MKKFLVVFVLFLFMPICVNAQRGCCSHHGGVAGCSSNGRQICNDGTLSPSCTCTPAVTYIYGCTDSAAKNYNSRANKDNGSCVYYKYGCMDQKAKNYDATAEKSDNSCEYYIEGCMDKTAKNYNELAEKDNNSCEYYKYGCMDKTAKNYDATAEKSDDSCEYDTALVSKIDNANKDSEDSNGGLGVVVIGGAIATYLYFRAKKKSA